MSKKLLSCFGKKRSSPRRDTCAPSLTLPPSYSLMDVPREQQKKPSLVSQFANKVTDFSSQYGSENSISYAASNLAGRSSVYPTYGDFTQACAFRTYGPWWNKAPSAKRKFMKRPNKFVSEDYIELLFDIDVYPCKIEVWETYNPGAVVRIMACDNTGTDVDSGNVRWQILWEGGPEQAPHQSRIFSPTLNTPKFKSNLIRLELCHRLCHYYTFLDCVVMYGSLTPYPDMHHISLIQQQMAEIKDSSEADNYVYMVTSLMNEWNLGSQPEGNVGTKPLEIGQQVLQRENSATRDPPGFSDVSLDNIELWEGKQEKDLCPQSNSYDVETLQQGEMTEERKEDAGILSEGNGFFDLLPDEVIQLIFSYLDLPSIFTVCRTCSLLQKHGYDPQQFTEVNLQPYWHKVDNILLESLERRCCYLQHLNLSWCGGSRGIVSTAVLDRLLKACGGELVSLYLASCTFVTSDTLKSIAENCPKLQDLDVQSCTKIDNLGLLHLMKLEKLYKLNLYRTLVDIHSLIALIRSSPHLQSLNLGSCTSINNFDDVAVELGKHCKKLKTLDLWRARTITDVGLRAIASNCLDLEELDLGWCAELRSGSGCIKDLAQKCVKLRKLFLTANRTVCDADIYAISCHCTSLEQLDILGTRQVTKDAASSLLKNCRKLVMFDVSFCAWIDFQCVQEWSEEFPNVNIKKSFQH